MRLLRMSASENNIFKICSQHIENSPAPAVVWVSGDPFCRPRYEKGRMNARRAFIVAAAEKKKLVELPPWK